MLTKEELNHLEDLSAINIEKDQEDLFLEKLTSIVKYLDLLNEINTDATIETNNWWENNQKMQHTINDCSDSKEILFNVNHEVVNNCIMIKSVLS